MVVEAHQVDYDADDWDQVVDLGEARIPILVHISEYSKAWAVFFEMILLILFRSIQI